VIFEDKAVHGLPQKKVSRRVPNVSSNPVAFAPHF
jgi:hypothetical protein